jgi:large subunit ribosomal protein L10
MDENGTGRQGSPRPEKVAVVDEVRERLSSASAALLTEYRGLKVTELAELRRTIRAAGGDYKVYKNTLVRFAVADLGVEGLDEHLTGPTAIAFVDGDAVTVAKALRDYSRTNPNLVLKGGVLGERAITADEITALAAVPPREELLARIAGGLAAPLSGFAGLLQALPRNLAYGLQALVDQGGAPAGAAPAAGAPEAEATESAETAAASAAEAPADVTDEPVAIGDTEAMVEAVADVPEAGAGGAAAATAVAGAEVAATDAPDTPAAGAPAPAAPEAEAAPAADATTESPEEA